MWSSVPVSVADPPDRVEDAVDIDTVEVAVWLPANEFLLACVLTEVLAPVDVDNNDTGLLIVNTPEAELFPRAPAVPEH